MGRRRRSLVEEKRMELRRSEPWCWNRDDHQARTRSTLRHGEQPGIPLDACCVRFDRDFAYVTAMMDVHATGIRSMML